MEQHGVPQVKSSPAGASCWMTVARGALSRMLMPLTVTDPVPRLRRGGSEVSRLMWPKLAHRVPTEPPSSLATQSGVSRIRPRPSASEWARAHEPRSTRPSRLLSPEREHRRPLLWRGKRGSESDQPLGSAGSVSASFRSSHLEVLTAPRACGTLSICEARLTTGILRASCVALMLMGSRYMVATAGRKRMNIMAGSSHHTGRSPNTHILDNTATQTLKARHTMPRRI
mmetsp:Transcript_9359/g.29236  ORF Transcript_9359/g.29236 Transcript_9359/m.29236 type:complete len:228 (+) Transcript_9359:1396-2079(+)